MTNAETSSADLTVRLGRYFDRPPYFYHPGQVLKRFAVGFKRTRQTVTLPWGMDLTVNPQEGVGRSIYITGTHDLPAVEAVFRLLSVGDTAVDVGANIGFMTAAMVKAVGPSGTVMSFEPHPAIFRALEENVSKWRDMAKIHIHRVACSEEDGRAFLYIPEDFGGNEGTATLLNCTNAKAQHSVNTIRLDSFLANTGLIKLAKIDVEQHELSVLRGAGALIAAHKIVNILFEDHIAYPSPVRRFLAENGYTLYRLHRSFRSPVLLPPDVVPESRPYAVTPNYLATLDSSVSQRFVDRGWQAL